MSITEFFYILSVISGLLCGISIFWLMPFKKTRLISVVMLSCGIALTLTIQATIEFVPSIKSEIEWKMKAVGP